VGRGLPGEPGGVGVEGVGAAEELLDEVGGVTGAAGGEDEVAVAMGDLGVEQVVRVEGAEAST
jgi:hypothetical protein